MKGHAATGKEEEEEEEEKEEVGRGNEQRGLLDPQREMSLPSVACGGEAAAAARRMHGAHSVQIGTATRHEDNSRSIGKGRRQVVVNCCFHLHSRVTLRPV
jgi:S-adenosylmethionine synthetase